MRNAIQTLSHRKRTIDLVWNDLNRRIENETDLDKKQVWETLMAFALASRSYCDQLENLWISNLALKNQMIALKEMILSIPFIRNSPEVGHNIELLFRGHDSAE